MASGRGIPVRKGETGGFGGNWFIEGVLGAGGVSKVDGCSGVDGRGGFIPGKSKSGGSGGRSEILGGPLLFILKKTTR